MNISDFRAFYPARELLRAALDLVYPRYCACCGGDVPDAGHICWDCRTAVSKIAFPFCSVCGDPVDGVIDRSYVCSACVSKKPRFDAARSAARYRGVLKEIVRQFKYERATYLCGDLVELLQACVRVHYGRIRPDAVTYVPLYRRKERERTYNQSALLARGLARGLGLPVLDELVRRRDTASQTRLTAVRRRANVRRAFGVRAPEWIEGRNMLLVDDVMTTGATANECAGVLKDAGAAGVYVVTVGRG